MLFLRDSEEVKQKLEMLQQQYDESMEEMQQQMEQNETCKTHLRSLVEILTDLMEYILTKCLSGPPATSRSQSSILGGTQDFGHNNSYSSDPMYKVFDDEKRNHSEFIKNMLTAKLDVINTTVKGLNIDNEISKIESWKMIDDFVSEHNSPLNHNSFRRSSRMESEIAPFFGLASTHKTQSGSSHRRPMIKNESFRMSFQSRDSMEKLKVNKTQNKLIHRKSVNVKGSDSKHNLIHEDSMMNIGASKLDLDKKTSPIMGAPSIEDIEEEKEYHKIDDEDVISIRRFRGNTFTNSDICDESAIEDIKSNENLTSKGSLSHLVKSISFNELGHAQEPAVIGLRLGGLTSFTLSNPLAPNEPGLSMKRGPVSEFSAYSSKKFFGRLNNSTNTLEDKQMTKSMKKVPLSENKNFESKVLKKQESEESLILAVTAKDNLSEKGFGSFMNSDNFDDEDEKSKSVFSHDYDKDKAFKFKFKDPIIEGGGNFIKQKSMDLEYTEKRRAYSTFINQSHKGSSQQSN